MLSHVDLPPQALLTFQEVVRHTHAPGHCIKDPLPPGMASDVQRDLGKFVNKDGFIHIGYPSSWVNPGMPETISTLALKVF